MAFPQILLDFTQLLAPDILVRDISKQTFHHWDISACSCFGLADALAHGHFGTRNFLHHGCLARDMSAPEHFGTWIFWHLAKQYGHFGTDILAPWHLCYCAKMSFFQNVPTPKSPCTKTSMEKICPCAGTPTEPECPGDEMSVRKCPWPRCQVSK